MENNTIKDLRFRILEIHRKVKLNQMSVKKAKKFLDIAEKIIDVEAMKIKHWMYEGLH